ncbi:hypothetical protein [Corynebacterium sp.]|uniref:hypothetical protein n=1 Tax=Corynebacterium sp. TaxID=1720 RepID=UPI0026E102FA|nr:hypothetical protein [Corynebacterium sp.]MDO5512253.1 hypothetical protein [Corynebacterium sp.]
MGDVTTLRLAHGAHVYLRGRDALQFGVDATRAGVVETTLAPVIMSALLRARRARPRTELVTTLTSAGLDRAAAESLLDDLCAYRILVPQEEHSVILLGRGRLAQQLVDILHTSGVTVRSPVRGESEYAYLAAAEVTVPVVVVDRLAHSRAMAPMLTRFAPTSVPVSLVDHRGVIGPLRIDAAGPCPLCHDLHHTDRDTQWHRVVTQLPGGPASPSPAAEGMVAGQAGALIAALAGVPAPPGVAPLSPAPGEVTITDPWVGVTREVMHSHPRCPVCFALRQRKAPMTASNCAP